jgi:TatD DNase family protein
VNPPWEGIVDTHAHMCDPVFDTDLPQVLERARREGVSAVIAVSEDLADAQKNLRLAATDPMIRPAAGLYPTRLDPGQAADMCEFIRMNRDRLAAVGEVGLDHWAVQEEDGRALQREIFTGFIGLARELRLPLNVHSRSAGRRTIEVLLGCGAERVQLHAFDGNHASALAAVEAGYFFSIPPSVVRSPQKQKLVRRLPLRCLLVETDSPVLGPAPQERNEPANVRVAIRAIAEIRGIGETEVIEALRENTRRLYS